MTNPIDGLTQEQRDMLRRIIIARSKGKELHPFWDEWETMLRRQQEQKQGQGIKST